MIGKKVLSSVAGIVVVAAMAFGATQAFAVAPKTGYAPGCEPHTRAVRSEIPASPARCCAVIRCNPIRSEARVL
ncbi:TPA: hypothetical protein ACKQBZ_001078 [Stenotrophomonas maltophilia]